MPDIDPKYDHLVTLCREYQETIDQIQSGLLESEDIHYLTGQRSVIHDQIIAEMQRLGMTISSREEAMRRAIILARWFGEE